MGVFNSFDFVPKEYIMISPLQSSFVVLPLQNYIISSNLSKTLLVIAGITWFNPHVYLDTVFLVGSISNSLHPNKQIPFLIGTVTSSFLFFFFLGYIGYKIGPMINTPSLWKKINITLGIIMILIAFNLIYVYLLK